MTGSHQHHDHEGPAPDVTTMYSEEFWDERYSSSAALWSGNPNPQLVAEVANLPAGKALDAGCGEGADVIWLAERGWQVTGVDVSGVALARGAAHASEFGTEVAARISWERHDLLSWIPPAQSYDLISAQYMQVHPELRAPLVDRLAAGVAPGGTLLLVGHSPSDLTTTVHRPQQPERFFTAAEIAAALDASAWAMVVCETRPRQVRDPDGQLVTVHDEVIRAKRS